ncbi:MAG: TrmH family RNA methyltransferase, partial [Alistipes sp.]|nr:TrmH family RNA methyltransferase [Alistipes sp.]
PETFDVEKGPFCLVFGTEHAGVSDEIIEAADEYLRIPMCGMVESLNVSASAAILIYMLSQRMRLSPSIDWRLTEDDASEMMFRWVMSSVKDAERILERQFPL